MRRTVSIRILSFVALSLVVMIPAYWIGYTSGLVRDGITASATRIFHNIVAAEQVAYSHTDVDLQRIDSLVRLSLIHEDVRSSIVIERIRCADAWQPPSPEYDLQLPAVALGNGDCLQLNLVDLRFDMLWRMRMMLIISIITIAAVGYCLWLMLRSFDREQLLRRQQADFAHALIHNMATPLQTIGQINQLLAADAVAADSARRTLYGELARRQTNELQGIINQILTVACGEQGMLQIVRTSTNITNLATQTVEQFRLQAGPQVSFEVHSRPESIHFDADDVLLQQVLNNLVDNAVKYGGEAVTITIDCQLTNAGLHIGVADDGPGIDPRLIDKLFEPYHRSHEARRNGIAGYGIGLSFVYNVVTAHGGTVSIDRTRPKGTRFNIFIANHANPAP